ncbi:hypothetical protein L195_g040366 [Trifolium pratense]|uniref:Uncharacterized protein n=1 Tax=Trifolium pratense TaxID=57577 RepID=A0A2K3M0J4_TRIPR|nr:hypothetical protein L195_g040366 [Trifolium pratense]
MSLIRLPSEYPSASSSLSKSWSIDHIPEELLSPIRHPIILPLESSRETDPSASSSIHMHSKSMEKN